MKNKNIKKIFTIIFMFILILSVCYNVSFASVSSTIKSKFSGELDTTASGSVSNLIGTAINYIANIGTAIAIIILSIIGIKYILASAGERADIKRYLMNYCIGAMILFGASSILKIIVSFAGNL